ncbi:MAG: TonB-dependent receptor [Sporocytophaga sp.]|nr:TonB-dependent receptor [Sporocytophaga sp.]
MKIFLKVVHFFLLLFLYTNVFSQKIEFKGRVKSNTDEGLTGALVSLKEADKGALTDLNGNFSITIEKGTYTLSVFSAGYKDYIKKVQLDEDVAITIVMEEDITELNAVEVISERTNVENTDIGVNKVDLMQMKKLPALLGEVDVIKNVQMMPGVQVTGEGNAGFYVRGGSADQNLILLDYAPIYYSSHLFGIFSVFNSDILKSVTLYKGGIPVEHGGRLSSVLDIKTKDNRPGKITGILTAGTGIYKLSVQGQLRSKTSYMVSVRRSIIDILPMVLSSVDPKQPKSILFFHDINTRLNHDFSAKSKMFVSFYNGRDHYNINNFFSSTYTNTTGTLGWKYLINERLTSNTHFVYSRFAYRFGLNVGVSAFELRNGIEEYGIKQDFRYNLNSFNALNFGISGTYRNYSPGKFIPTDGNSMFSPIKLDQLHSGDLGVYVSNTQKVSARIALEYGMRFSIFNRLGKGNEYIYDGAMEQANIVDTIHYKSLEPMKTYYGFEPRISGRYLLNENNSVKLSYDRMVQYMHMLSNTTAPVPQNIWMPSATYIEPQKSHQVAAGYFKSLLNNKVEFSAETYYKHIQNALDFKDNAQLSLNPAMETEIRRGFGWSYGIEFYLRATTKKVTASLSYTWSKSQLKINGVNNDKAYFASYDRRNSLNVLCSYDLKPRINIAGNFVYSTGRPMTLPAAKYNYGYVTGSYYHERNGYRMPDFHHLDLAVNYYPKKKLKKHTPIKIPLEKHFSFSIYNVYGRRNAYFVYTRDNKDNPNKKEVVMVYLFRWLPSITVDIKF